MSRLLLLIVLAAAGCAGVRDHARAQQPAQQPAPALVGDPCRCGDRRCDGHPTVVIDHEG
ncbi:MAG: hypothetical protein M9894_02470 [Planctomycetes bacterium]|nr:hypothetical protein [Planctomycetota bacterium]